MLVRPFSFEETPESRTQESGDNENHELIYTADGETDDYTVHSYALSLCPLNVARPSGLLFRSAIRVEPVGHAIYRVYAAYGRKAAQVGNFTFSFDTTGATVNIKCAKSHVKSYPVDGNWHKGAINVKKTDHGHEAEGADIVIPALKMTYTFRHPLGVLNETYARTMARVTGRTNLNPFRIFDAGELLFLGATGSDGSEAEAECTYQMVASENSVGLSIGGIVDIAKKGHDYAWIEFEDEAHEGEAVLRPKRAHVELVYDSFNFSDVFGWG